MSLRSRTMFWMALFVTSTVIFNFGLALKETQAQETFASQVQVLTVSVCGNGVIEAGETCDSGANNGVYSYSAATKNCNTTCNGWAPYCADGTVQATWEQCDDGNNVSGDGCASNCTSEAPSPPVGGGGGYVPPPETRVIFQGRAYPLSRVTILKDGQVAVTTIAGPDANFNVALTGLTGGNYVFSVYGEDSKLRRSALFTFAVYVTPGTTTTISGIFLSPTIDADKAEVRRGDNLAIFGQSVPIGEITIAVSSEEDIFLKTKADKDGVYLYSFDTSVLAFGQHLAKSKAASEGAISPFGRTVGFLVSTRSVARAAVKCGRADLNCDGRVNLVDFSIAAYWYKRPLSEAFKQIEKERLNGDGKITLTDFSIMAFYWTG